MSLLEQVEDWLLTEAESALHNYAKQLQLDIERYAIGLARRVLQTLALGLAGVALLLVGSVFMLIGAETYLSSVITPPLAWGLVGLVTGVCGTLILRVARHRT